MTSPKTVPLKKPCEYCGCDLPVGIDNAVDKVFDRALKRTKR